MRVAHLVDTLSPDRSGYGLEALARSARTADLELVVVVPSGSGNGGRAAALRRSGAVVVEHGWRRGTRARPAPQRPGTAHRYTLAL
ncbi:hypothetical protein LWC33_31755 [Pseudonocardia sp. RS11V-5]|uniref:hypothetical protein n=1 Tax=Pseudonocardia terrae TaxID=2905831 RepID=UPI001E3DF933|nr:hypothetical protein [Pseudonocardia terrae]MCE3556004.1 hypothetical protein [Pseudonocardia terrae]